MNQPKAAAEELGHPPDAANSDPLAQDMHVQMIRSLFRESLQLKSQIEQLKIEERRMTHLTDENSKLKETIKQYENLDIEVNHLEERITGIIDKANEELRVQLIDRDKRIRVTESQVAAMKAEARVHDCTMTQLLDQVARLKAEAGTFDANMAQLLNELGQSKMQQEQGTQKHASEIQILKQKIAHLEAQGQEYAANSHLEAKERSEEANKALIDGTKTFTDVVNSLQEWFKNHEEQNKEHFQHLAESSRNIKARLGFESILILILLWVLDKLWDWSSAYLANIAAAQTSAVLDAKREV